jgi:magnesium transporter
MNDNESFIYFANWMGARVLDQNKKPVGRFWDFEINPQEPYPPVTGVILYRGFWKRHYAELPWSQFEVLDNRKLRFLGNASEVVFTRPLRRDVFRLRKDVLDQQVVDTHHHKVIRVADVHLLCVRGLRVVHVDIGTRGLMRRLGFERALDQVLRRLYPKASYLSSEQLVSWKFVKTVSLDPATPIQIDLTSKQLSQIPPADLGELMMDLDIQQRVALFRTADKVQRARLFERLDFQQQEQLLENLETKEAVEVLTTMSADEAVDLLGSMAPEQSRQLLSLMESSRAKRLSQLLGYEEDEAGGIMTTEYLEIPQQLTVKETIDLIRIKTPQLETIYYLYVVNDQKQLLGTTTLRQLIGAPSETPVLQTIFPKPLFVYTHASMKEVAFLMDKYKVSALPVVNKEKNLQGIITVDDVLHQVIPIAWRRRRAGRKHPSL